jgi:ATPase subunit of ABC transporter with duplicated ATPase domains
LITAANIIMQIGAKPLFRNISVKVGDGNRYGLTGANGCRKSTFMKITDRSLAPARGMKLRVLVARALLSDPDILLIDEPTNNLDMEAIEALNLALEHYEGTLIFVSHDREFVRTLASRVIEIKDHKLLDFQGSWEEYPASHELAQCSKVVRRA